MMMTMYSTVIIRGTPRNLASLRLGIKSIKHNFHDNRTKVTILQKLE